MPAFRAVCGVTPHLGLLSADSPWFGRFRFGASPARTAPAVVVSWWPWWPWFLVVWCGEGRHILDDPTSGQGRGRIVVRPYTCVLDGHTIPLHIEQPAIRADTQTGRHTTQTKAAKMRFNMMTDTKVLSDATLRFSSHEHTQDVAYLTATDALEHCRDDIESAHNLLTVAADSPGWNTPGREFLKFISYHVLDVDTTQSYSLRDAGNACRNAAAVLRIAFPFLRETE